MRAKVLLVAVLFLSCANDKEDKFIWKSMQVKVSAYNSVPSQTDGEPNIAAWGDTLKPRMKAIAVSRDLLALGLKHNTKVMIKGLPGVYLVKDKMAKRWTKRIDIYMGEKVEKAKKWGVQDLEIVYAIEKDTLTHSVKE
ncbi:hypothetical protein FEE95_12765 [Maribacter algarum]|uniref:3D (Asp-Asp-Asp) domain-containing protein n=1 Tax=Maribacter algarum (ex Zhang et al. 2020) TaxID=2578118 RepID=A0A5S3PRI7_9FLAO|nr:3D domain-containing protein [Maribacter algarum]TMM57350.1 hypothetical protein FEE95_12765 [Maribacter algarum]